MRSGDEEDSGVSAGRGVLAEPGAQVVLALGLEQVVEGAEFGAVLGTSGDLGGAARGQLSVALRSVAHGGEPWSYAACFRLAFRCGLRRVQRAACDVPVGGGAHQVGLALVAARGA